MESRKTDPLSLKLDRDIAYPVRGKKNDLHVLDVYSPSSRPPRLCPTIIFVHGGGLSKGDKASIREIGERFASDEFVVVSPNYRLAPIVRNPDIVNDVAAATSLTVKNIKSFGGDPNSIFIAGGSAGGYLATLVALDEQYLQHYKLSPRHLRGLISITSLVDVAMIPQRRLDVMWGNDKELIAKASPINHVNIRSLPTLILYADGDTQTRREMQFDSRKKFEKERHSNWFIYELANRKHETIAPNMRQKNDPANRHIRKFIEKHKR